MERVCLTAGKRAVTVTELWDGRERTGVRQESLGYRRVRAMLWKSVLQQGDSDRPYSTFYVVCVVILYLCRVWKGRVLPACPDTHV